LQFYIANNVEECYIKKVNELQEQNKKGVLLKNEKEQKHFI
jgi:uncharacterized protein YnzC (UPF0291/DUF896 family)